MDYSKKDTLYEQAKTSLKKFKGEQVQGSSSESGGANSAIKLGPTDAVEQEKSYRRLDKMDI